MKSKLDRSVGGFKNRKTPVKLGVCRDISSGKYYATAFGHKSVERVVDNLPLRATNDREAKRIFESLSELLPQEVARLGISWQTTANT